MSVKLKRIRTGLESTERDLSSLGPGEDELSLAEQNQERLTEYKSQLNVLYDKLTGLDIKEDDELLATHAELEAKLFDCARRIKKFLREVTDCSKTGATGGVTTKIPKLDIPTFDGEILNWQQFWDQFAVAIHDRKNISNAEKLLYLEQALRSGSTAKAIEGLSQTVTHYEQAVQHLKERYHRPLLVFCERVRNLINLHPVKDGSGRRFHEATRQNLRALSSPWTWKTTTHSSPPFRAQDRPRNPEKVPSYNEFLGFIDGRAQAAGSSSIPKHPTKVVPLVKKQSMSDSFLKPVSSFTVSARNSTPHNCVLCPSQCHPLHLCAKFKSQSLEERHSFVKSNPLCFNCLRSGHQLSQCISTYQCKRCRGNHHTLLHRDT